MATENKVESFTEQDIQDFQSLVSWLPEEMEGMWTALDENLLETGTVDTGLFFTSPDSSPVSPFGESQCSSSPKEDSSPFSDFQPLETSSSDDDNLFTFDNQTIGSLGLESLDQNEFLSLNPLLGDLQGTAFQGSSLPPLPIAEMNPKNTRTTEKPTKKRRRNQKDESMVSKLKAVKFEPLSRDDLLKMDSSEIEEYIKLISSNHTLPPSEEKELKSIRRLIKNREYAQSSRNKKKQYMEEMEKKLAEVEEAKEVLQNRVDQLESENKMLKTHLAKIGAAMKRDPTILQKFKEISKTTTNPSPSRHSRSSPPIVKTGMVLFMVILSFGFFFQPQEPRNEIGGFTGHSMNRKLFTPIEPSPLDNFQNFLGYFFQLPSPFKLNDPLLSPSFVIPNPSSSSSSSTNVQPKVKIVKKVLVCQSTWSHPFLNPLEMCQTVKKR